MNYVERAELRVKAKELLQGSIDFHIHSGPDIFKRRMDDFEVAEAAKAAGMKAVLLKNHVDCTAGRAAIATKYTDFPVFGGLALNHQAGGLNPEAVKVAVQMGAKEIWMPTIHATHYLKNVGAVPMFAAMLKAGMTGISLLNDDGSLKDEVKKIIDSIAEADVVLASGHVSKEEAFQMVTAAKAGGVKKIVITHPTSPMEAYTIQDMKDIVAAGATMLEHVVNDITHQMKHPIEPEIIADALKAIGPEHSLMSTDSGQVINPAPAESMESYIYEMLKLDVPADDIYAMTHTNPAMLLDLE